MLVGERGQSAFLPSQCVGILMTKSVQLLSLKSGFLLGATLPVDRPSSFIGDFQVARNISHSLAVVSTLWSLREEATSPATKRYLQKPMIILNVAIIEALLYDFHKRVKWFTREGVMGMPVNIVTYIRGKQIDKLEALIASCRKHDLFDELGSSFYEDLDILRRIRNRVHLQNEKHDLEPDDAIAFSAERLFLSERAVEFVMLTLEAKYPRSVNVYTPPFHLPWPTYFE